MAGRRYWRRLLIALAFPGALAAATGAQAASCSGTDAVGNVFTFSDVPDTLAFGEPLTFSLAIAGANADPAGGLDFTDGPRYGTAPDAGAPATAVEAPIARYLQSSPPGTRRLLGVPVAGTHYFRTSRSAAVDAAPCITTVSANPTVTNLIASPAVSAYGDPVGITALVSAATLPTGTVAVTDNGTPRGTATLAPRPVMGTLALGADHGCMVTAGRGLACWGENGSGQLGNGTGVARTYANPTTPIASGAVGVAAGNGFTCAALADGTASCWGLGTSGQLGDDTVNSRSTPAPVARLANVRTLAAGDSHACALTGEGAVFCWGDGTDGRLGTGSTAARRAPVQVIDENVRAIAAGRRHTCALANDGGVSCWGSNASGQLGTGGGGTSLPTAVIGLTLPATAIAAGGDETCALLSDTTVRCWGDNAYGQIGDGSTGNLRSAPTVVQNLANVVSLSVGDANACAIRSDGTAACWGRGDRGRIGDGYVDGTDPLRLVSTPKTVASFAAGASIFQLNGRADPGSPELRTLPAGIVLGRGRALVVSDLGAVTGWGALSVASIEPVADSLSPVALSPARTARLDAVATLRTTAIEAGSNKSIVARYGGDANRSASVSPAAIVAVSKGTVSITGFTATPNTVRFGDAVTLRATLSPAISDGVVEFLNEGSVVGTATVVNGVALTTSGSIPIGNSRIIGLRFPESTNYLAAASGLTQTVNVSRQTASVAIDADKTLADYGETVTITVRVTPPAATGQVILIDGSTSIASTTLVNGVATFPLTTLSPATVHTLKATYLGDSNVDGATSSTVGVEIRKLAVGVSISTTPASPQYGDTVTVKATVASPLRVTGTVTLSIAGQSTTVALQNDLTASAEFNGINAGTHLVTASYNGDAISFGKTVNTSLTIRKRTPSISVVSVAALADPRVGETFALQATVTPSNVPGQLTFTEDATLGNFGTVNIVNGLASANVTNPTVGSHTYRISYNETANYTAANVTRVVNVVKGDVSVTLSAGDVVYGQENRFVAALTPLFPASGVLDGRVQFFSDGASIGTASVSTDGVATLPVQRTAVGDHTITATYLGNSAYNTAQADAITETVSKGTTTVAVSMSTTSVVAGGSVTITATVAPQSPAAGSPSGQVTFFDGATQIGSVALALKSGSMQAALTTTTLSIGSHDITAIYAGDGNFLGDSNGTGSVTVQRTAPTITISIFGKSGTTFTYGTELRFMAKVPPIVQGMGIAVPTGPLTFFDGIVPLGSTPWWTRDGENNSYFGQDAVLSPGVHTISAFYGGDANFDRSTSSDLVVTINKIPTTASLSITDRTTGAAVANPAFGQILKFTTTVNASGVTVNAGTVDVIARKGTTDTVLATVPVSAGIAVANVALPPAAGFYDVRAVYSGSDTLLSSTAPATTLVSQSVTTTVALSFSTPSAGQATTFTISDPVTIRADVDGELNGSGPPTGTVTVKIPGLPDRRVDVVDRVARLSTTTLPVGTYTVSVEYGGDTAHANALASRQITIAPAPTATTLTVPATMVKGQAVTVFGSVSTLVAGLGLPTGTVTILDETTNRTLGAATLSGGEYRFTLPDLDVGVHGLTARYASPPANFATSDSARMPVTVGAAATAVSLSGPNTRLYGQTGRIAITVAPRAPGGGIPTGSVVLKTATATLATLPLVAGQASFDTSPLAVGAYDITAVYAGDGSYLAATSSAYTLSVAKAPTATALAPPAAGVFGQPLSLSATVTTTSPASGTPTGTVTFFDGTRVLGRATLAAGAAAIAAPTLGAGTHAIQATFDGDGTFIASTSTVASIAIGKAASTTTVSAPASAVTGETVTVTATVAAAAPSTATPTGSVLFRLDGALIGSTTLDTTGKASLATTLLPGVRTLTAAYVGDAGVLSSDAAPSTITIGPGATAVTLDLPANAAFGQPVTLAATVTPAAPATGVPTGVVEFRDGATLLGRSTLSRGVASVTLSSLALGARSITANYLGDGKYQSASSAAGSSAIGAGPVTIAVSAPPTRAIGEAATITATVRSVYAAAGTPGGFVAFADGVTPLGRVALATGQASVTVSGLAVGAHTLTATYEGTPTFATASASTSTTVGKAGTTTGLAAPASPVVGQPVAVTVTVRAVTTTATVPGGSVDIFDGAARIGGGTLAGGTATVTLAALPLGRHGLTAVYGGDANFTGSSSATVQSTVGKGAVTAALSADPATPVAGQPVSVTATIAAAAPAVGVPTGSVTLRDGSVVVGTAVLAGGRATLALPAPTAGSHALSLSYPGDDGFLPGTSSLALAVAKGATAVALTGPSSVRYGATATYSLRVTPVAPATGTPGGTVVLSDGATTLGSVTLSAGAATFSTAALPAGSRSITAAYQGDPSYLAATSAPVATTVAKAGTALALAATPALVRPGGSVALTATASLASGTGTPTGAVTFRQDGKAIGTVALALGKASLARTLETSGSVTVTASYAGTANLLASTATTTVTVDAAVGPPEAVPTTGTGLQASPAAARLAAGGTVVAWVQGDGSSTGIYARRYLASGAAASTPVRVNTVTAGAQTAPAVAALSGGGYVIAWQSTGQDGSGTSIHLQRYGANGGLVGSEQRANGTTLGDQTAPSAAGLADDAFAVGWTTRALGGTTGSAMIRIFSASGTAATADVALDAAVANQDTVELAGLAGGSVAAAWTVNTANATVATAKVRIVGADGKLGADPTTVGSVTRGADRTVALAATAGGGFALAYASAATGRAPAVMVRRYDASAVAVGTARSVGPVTTLAETEPSIAAFPSGGVVVGWTAATAGETAIGYQRFRAGLTAADDPQTITLPAAVDRGQPAAVTRTDTAFDILFATAGAAGDVLRNAFTLGAPAP